MPKKKIAAKKLTSVKTLSARKAQRRMPLKTLRGSR